MSEFERLLDETLAVGMGDEYFQPWSKGLEVARAALLAHHERVVQERDRWKNEAMLMAAHQGIDNYQRCLDALAERDARIAELKRKIAGWAEDLKWADGLCTTVEAMREEGLTTGDDCA